MNLLDLMKTRRSIRRYLPRKVEKEKLDMVLEAGIYAPSPGGGQGTKIIMLDDADLIEKIGVINANCENRSRNVTVSADQPSILDDKTIKSGFYGCQALGIVCVPKALKTHVNCIGSAFACAQNMILMAYDLGVSSCIVGRAEATFSNPEMAELLSKWGLDENYMPLVFVCLGYIDGDYPAIIKRAEGRTIYIPAEATCLS
ncbi:MAG: nitroreductase family protein [Eubacteriales bacterium]